jgi:hypothetical protein
MKKSRKKTKKADRDLSWYGEGHSLDIDASDPERCPPLAPSLFVRLQSHSPELALGLKHYLEESSQSFEGRRPYDGTDASACLFLLLMEGLLTFEQLRYEIQDQVKLFQKEKSFVPSHYLLAMSNLLSLETELIQAANLSWETHLAVWNTDDLLAFKERKAEALVSCGRWGDQSDEPIQDKDEGDESG